MKCNLLKVLLCSAWALLCPNFSIYAQEVQDTTNFFTLRQKLLEQLQNQNPAENEDEDSKLTRFHRWEWLWRNRLGDNGNMNTARNTMVKYLSDLKDGNVTLCDSPYDNDINWTNLGPFNSKGALTSTSYNPAYKCHSTLGKQNQGRIESISVNPKNSDEIVIGSWNSGAWRTKDGGKTWVNTTDDEGFSYFGIRSMVRHPANEKIIYATTGTEGNLWDGERYLYGTGIIMSEDGGISWKRTGHQNGERSHKIAIDPNSTLSNTILYFTTSISVHKWQGSHQANGAWTQIYLNYYYGDGPLWYKELYMRDIVVANDGSAWFTNFLGLFKIEANTNTAIQINFPLPTSYQTLINCPLDPLQRLRNDISLRVNRQGHIVFIAQLNKIKSVTTTECFADSPNTYIYKSTDNGVTWTSKVCNLDVRIETIQFNINPNNSDIIYGEGGRCMYKSTDGGTTFTVMNGAENHPDVRDIVTFASESEIVFVATDGGISKTTNGLDWKDITGEGLSIANFYGVGITEKNDKILFAGAQDNNINYYNNGNWYETDPFGDNGDCLIAGAKDDVIYQESQNYLEVGKIKGNNVAINSSEYAGNWESPLLLNPANNNEFFIGTTYLQYGTVPNATLKIDAYSPNTHSQFDYNVSSVAMSRNNGNVVYYSLYDKGTLGIFKATRTGTTWAITNITNNLATLKLKQYITDIAVDQSNENRIWVTIGGFEDRVKVFKTENSGTTWENVSGCLQNFPVLSICYQEGSNDRLYIGTDIGVFYRDNLQTDWAKYGNGGPPCMVSDMEINQCSGKLVVATYGRGLWEAPLLTNIATEISTGSTTWNRNRTVASDIRVKKGATLKIEGTAATPTVIGFGRGVRIIVEDGAKLEVTNATLTNACGYMWQGIEAWGNKNLRQLAANQSVIKLTNATIEYANNAITTWKVGDLNTTGAIIQATDSKFINNTRSVEYMKYQNKNSNGNPNGNIGRFTNCSFTINANYRRTGDFKHHISMWGVDGIVLYDVSFKNELSFPYDQELNSAIRTLDATFWIDTQCSSVPCGTVKNIFKGFNKGIYSSSSLGFSQLGVYNSNFSNNAIGIHSEGNFSLYMLENTFTIGNQSIITGFMNIHEGVISMSDKFLSIRENTFTPTFNDVSMPTTIGIRVKDNGENDNTIFMNTFSKNNTLNSNIFYGNLANGLNRGQNNKNVGLRYSCNKHINNIRNGFDIAVTDEGIALDQGSANFAAGNTFSGGVNGNGAPLGSDFYNDTKTTINYFYMFKPSSEEPQNIVNLKKILAKEPAVCSFDDGFTTTTVDTIESSSSKINLAIRQVLNNKDSLNFDLLRYWLKKENTVESYMSIVESYLQEDKAEFALQTLATIPLKFSFDAEGKKEFDYYSMLKNMQAMWIRNGLSPINLPTNEIAALKVIAENSKRKAGDAARGLLNFAYQTQYFIPPTLPKETGEKGIEASERTENTTKTNATNVTLIAFPNPASHIVNFEYHTQDRTLNGAAEVVVRNTLGQVIKRFKMTSDGLISWNIESLEGGIYYYSLENAEKVIITAQQLIIAK